ncbi:MAG: D-alanyl-D-alanine carboxypeptidase/D-alanyl-D-alanine-endopeptidase [Acidobacteriota bacterium]
MRKSLGAFKVAFITAASLGFLTFSFGIGAQSSSQSRATRTPTPTPTATASPSPTVARQTLADLQSRIAGRLARPEVLRGQIGMKIVSLNTGKVIFEQNGEKYLMPASNMKNFTVAAAIEKLTPDFKFVTSVYANSLPNASGTIRGDLRIYGRGDVSISTAFFGTSAKDPETYYKGIDRLADKIATAGVKRIEGDLVGDESYFRGNAIPGSWEYDDLQWYYGAEISAFPINDSAVDLTVKPGTSGSPCVVRMMPANPVMSVDNRCTTTGSGISRSLEINKKPNQNVIEITGTLSVGDNGFSGSIAVSHPADLFMAMLKERLVKRGIAVTGQTRTVNFESKARVNSPALRALTNFGTQPTVPVYSVPVEITRLESPPFSEVAAKTMKPSQNMYTETILWTLGEKYREEMSASAATTGGASPSGNSDMLGLIVTKAFRHQIGIPDDAVIQHDGCGLSRHDLITASAVVQLYTYMAEQSKYSNEWRNALTIAGVDGTLRNRFKGTAGAGNVRGKTGTIDQVSALSGYLTTAGGEPVVFSAVVNGVPDGPTRTALIDEIILSVVSFNGRID